MSSLEQASLRIAVCVRQVVDPLAPLEVDASGKALDESHLARVLNESDECAVREAVRLRGEDGEIVAITVGPERAMDGLRRALALGADRAVLVERSAETVPDVRAVSSGLAAVVRTESANLVLMGSQSTEWGSAATIGMLAAELGWPSAWLVMSIDRDQEGSLVVERELEAQRRERSRIELPCVLAVQAGISVVPMVRIRELLAAKRKPIERAESAAGVERPPLELLSLSTPRSQREVVLLDGGPGESASTLVERLLADEIVTPPRGDR